uniref:Dimer_Tnp_hAT domain-containing protein n=1 Tax=Rhabditophanes sp. KR3021 TaxID=114890 RepID=A0AC35TIZ2_9BILA
MESSVLNKTAPTLAYRAKPNLIPTGRPIYKDTPRVVLNSESNFNKKAGESSKDSESFLTKRKIEYGKYIKPKKPKDTDSPVKRKSYVSKYDFDFPVIEETENSKRRQCRHCSWQCKISRRSSTTTIKEHMNACIPRLNFHRIKKIEDRARRNSVKALEQSRTHYNLPSEMKASKYDSQFPVKQLLDGRKQRECINCGWIAVLSKRTSTTILKNHILSCVKTKNNVIEGINDMKDDDIFDSSLDNTDESDDNQIPTLQDILDNATNMPLLNDLTLLKNYSVDGIPQMDEIPIVVSEADALLTCIVSTECHSVNILSNPLFLKFLQHINPNYICPKAELVTRVYQPTIINKLHDDISTSLSGKNFAVCVNQVSSKFPKMFSLKINYLNNWIKEERTLSVIESPTPNFNDIADKIDEELHKFKINGEYVLVTNVTDIYSSKITECSVQNLVKMCDKIFTLINSYFLPVKCLIQKCEGIISAFKSESDIQQTVLKAGFFCPMGFNLKYPKHVIKHLTDLEYVFLQQSLIQVYESNRNSESDLRDFSFTFNEMKLLKGCIRLMQPLNNLLQTLLNADTPLSELLKLIAIAEREIKNCIIFSDLALEVSTKFTTFELDDKFSKPIVDDLWSNHITFDEYEFNMEECLEDVRNILVVQTNKLFKKYLQNETTQIATFLNHHGYNTSFVRKEDWLSFQNNVETKMGSISCENGNSRIANSYSEFNRYDNDQQSPSLSEIERYKVKSKLNSDMDVPAFWESNKLCLPNLYVLATQYLSVPSSTCYTQRTCNEVQNILSNCEDYNIMNHKITNNLLIALNSTHFIGPK